jgi:hypothetical protein
VGKKHSAGKKIRLPNSHNLISGRISYNVRNLISGRISSKIYFSI